MKETRTFKSKKDTEKDNTNNQTPLGASSSVSQSTNPVKESETLSQNSSDSKQFPKELLIPPVIKTDLSKNENNEQETPESPYESFKFLPLTPSLRTALLRFCKFQSDSELAEIKNNVLHQKFAKGNNMSFRKFIKSGWHTNFRDNGVNYQEVKKYYNSRDFTAEVNKNITQNLKELRIFKEKLTTFQSPLNGKDTIQIPTFLYDSFSVYKDKMVYDVEHKHDIPSLQRYDKIHKNGQTAFDEDKEHDLDIEELNKSNFSKSFPEFGDLIKKEYKNRITHFLSKEDCIDRLIDININRDTIIGHIYDEYSQESINEDNDNLEEINLPPEINKMILEALTNNQYIKETLSTRTVFQAFNFITEEHFKSEIEDKLVDKIFEKYPRIAEICKKRKAYRKLISDSCLSATIDIYYYLFDMFPPQYNQKLLLNNDFYDFHLTECDKEKKRVSEKKEDILSRIPEHYKDSFPLARSIHREFIIHVGPTNSGKTHDAIEELKESNKGIYLAPLRLLAYEQYETLSSCNIKCNMITGEEKIMTEGAWVQSSTIEMLSLSNHYDVAVIDEAQMVSDRDRGGAWCTALYGVCAEKVHVCVAPEGEEIVRKIIEDCGDSYSVVQHKRLTPLRFTKSNYDLSSDIKPGDALIVFSRRSVHAVAAQLRKAGHNVSVVYGSLPYDVRHQEASKFADGTNTVVVATDAIGMGMNLPIKRVVFLEDSKYDGESVRQLTASEIKQIAGRAGRYGKYPVGAVASNFSTVIKAGLKSAVKPIDSVVVNFPESLVSVVGDLSETISIWASLPDEKVMHKADVTEMVQKAKWCESYTDDKELIYTFLKFPFDYSDNLIRGLWEELFMSVLKGKFVNVGKKTANFQFDKNSLNSLESDYRFCDLLYNFCDKFQPEDCSYLLDVKKDISELIIKALEKRGFEEKRCKRCGKLLEWDYPYGICQRCYNAGRSYRYNSWYYFDEGDDELDIDEF